MVQNHGPGSLWGAPTPGWTLHGVDLATSWQIIGISPGDVLVLPCGHQSQGAGSAGVLAPAPRGRSFPGLSARLKHSLRMAVVAVIFAVISAWGLIIPVCQSQKLRISELWGAGPHFPCLVEDSKKHHSGKPQILGYPTGWGRAAAYPEESVMAGRDSRGHGNHPPSALGF